ncbi:amidinotransferase [Echinicola marina]|uniref:citrulline utilization hydrolase CtlX n=1 Tax=Echinicola marina TaxID=2859768 RepID=UPI001CF71AA1|nr:arginine deiminase-related protein [Echinicola marina]UCS93802.1 amidinotransferase [Echinicola marina]
MNSQVTSTVLMVRPAAFGFNPETAKDNLYQVKDDRTGSAIQETALAEFDHMVAMLQEQGIRVLVLEDSVSPAKPDAVFPNNWFSTHEDGSIVFYPMLSRLRRAERRKDLVDKLFEFGFRTEEVVDLIFFEDDGQYLESTGSMVLDRENKIVYACASERTHSVPLHYFQQLKGYQVLMFHAVQQLKYPKRPVYHTNVMMHVGTKMAVVCLDSIEREAEKMAVKESLEKHGKKIIPITLHQKNAFAGNMLELKNMEGKHFTVMSASAFKSLKAGQKQIISKYTDLIVSDIPTIEKLGGGSVRCMMAEIFLPRVKK